MLPWIEEVPAQALLLFPAALLPTITVTIFFFLRKPGGFFRLFGQVKKQLYPEALQKKQPLPAGQSSNAMYLQKCAEMGPPITPASVVAVIKRAILRARYLCGNQYVRYKIIHGKKPASENPKKSAKHKNICFRNKHHRRRNQTSGDHNPGNPHSCADLVQNEITGNFKKERIL